MKIRFTTCASFHPQVHRILHTDVESLSAHRGMHVRGIAGEQDATLAVGRSLPRHIRKAGNPGGTVDSEVSPIDGDECLAHLAQRRLLGGSNLPLGQYHARRPWILHFADAMGRRPRPRASPTRAPRPIQPRRSASSLSHPTRESRCPLTCEPGCGHRRSPRRYSARKRWPSDSSTSTPLSSCAKPVTSRPR